LSEREVRELIAKAERSLRAAERLLEAGDHDFAVSRAYYAMFYAARALLLTRNVRRSKHSGVLAAFNSEFVRGVTFPPSCSRSCATASRTERRAITVSWPSPGLRRPPASTPLGGS